MEKRWLYEPASLLDKAQALSKEININPVLAAVLLNRGIETYDQAKLFFRPSLEHLHDPFLMMDMDTAVDRIGQAIQNEEKILIYGDYDVDGTTGVSLLYSFLRAFTSQIEFYIPDRYQEGYGISKKGVQWAVEKGYSLVIAIDCGIKAVDRIKEALESKVEFIVCDHHLPGEELPPARAILDPKRLDCNYPFKELSGCGIAFKLAQAYAQRNQMDPSLVFRYLDLVAVSVASDLVPITGENRTLTYFGLKKLNSDPIPGLKALIDVSGYSREIGISGIVFGLGPRINASGRIEHGKTAVKLLISEDPQEAKQISRQLDGVNQTRKDFDAQITQEALQIIGNDEKLRSAKSTVLFKEDWHKGVIGIVASRCIEKYYRPTVILTKSNQMATGSARSVKGFDLYSALTKCSDLIDQFGGHMYAAGMTIPLEKVDSFTDRFEQVVSEDILPEQLIPQIQVDHKINLNRINFKFYNILQQMAPFGPGNMDPIFTAEDLILSREPRILKDEHLKLYLKQEPQGSSFEAIGFGMASFGSKLNRNKSLSLAFSLSENNYMNQKSLVLIIKDLKID